MSELRTFRIRAPWDPNRATLNRRMSIFERNRVNDEGKQIGLLYWRRADCPIASGRVRVSGVVYRETPLDPDNLIAGLKPLFDGLFKRRITPDDSARWIVLGEFRQVNGPQWRRNEWTELVIEEIEDA